MRRLSLLYLVMCGVLVTPAAAWAQSVAQALGQRGIPTSTMRIEAYGETEPRVPTADGVREPQNRRVEIVFG